MKTNEEIIKELYCNVLLKSMNGANVLLSATLLSELLTI